MWVTLCIFFKVSHSWDKSHITQMSRLGQCPFPLHDHWDPRPSAGCFLSMALKCVSCYKHTWWMSFMVVWGIQSPWLTLWRGRAMNSWAEGPCLPPEPRPWCSSVINIETFLKPTNFCIWFLRSMWCLSEIAPNLLSLAGNIFMTFLEGGPRFSGPSSVRETLSCWPQSDTASRTYSGECLQLVLPHKVHDLWGYRSARQREVAVGCQVLEKKSTRDQRDPWGPFWKYFLGQSRDHRNGTILRGWSLSPAASIILFPISLSISSYPQILCWAPYMEHVT